MGQRSQQEESLGSDRQSGKLPCWKELQEVNRVDLTWQLGGEEVVLGGSSRQSGRAHPMKTSMSQGLHLCGCLNGEAAKLTSFSPYSDDSGNPTSSTRPSQDVSTHSQHLHLGLWC